MSQFRASLVALSVLIAALAPASSVADTLKLAYWDRSGSLAHYTRSDIDLQAARFVMPVPGEIRVIVVTLGGRSDTGRCRLRLFGHEGGGAIPFVESDLIEPVALRKSKSGLERLVVTLPKPLPIVDNQFFVAIDRRDMGVEVMTDRTEIRPTCIGAGDTMFYQSIRLANGTWYWERFAYAIDVIVDAIRAAPRHPFALLKDALPPGDTSRYNRSLAWYDVDRDNYLDLLWNGRLYRNDLGVRFEDVTAQAGLFGAPLANAFLDANSDGHVDVLFLGDRKDGESRLFLGSESGLFSYTPMAPTGITSPSSFSIGELTGDDRCDVVVLQSCDSGDCPCVLLIGDPQGGFVARVLSLEGAGPNGRGAPRRAGQLIDIDRDNDLDLFVASPFPGSSHVYLNDGRGGFEAASPESSLHELVYASGCDIRDVDDDGVFEVLLPRSTHPVQRKHRTEPGSTVTPIGAGLRHVPAASTVLPWESTQAGGTWGDADNNGHLDVLLTTSSPCSYAELYGASDSGFTSETFEYGLQWLSANSDATWVDFDNDGALDVATFIGHNLVLLRNTRSDVGNYVAFDLIDSSGLAIGATLGVHVEGKVLARQLVVGRGHLVSDPFRMHVGVGSARTVDSVVIQWPDGRRTCERNLAINGVHRIVRDSTGHAHGASLGAVLTARALPLPFRDRLTIEYTLPSRGHVRVALHGADGKLIEVLVDVTQSTGTHSIVWEPRDDQFRTTPSGTYVYRVEFEGQTASGFAQYQR